MRAFGTTLEEVGAESVSKHLPGSIAWRFQQTRLQHGGQDEAMDSSQNCHSLTAPGRASLLLIISEK